MIPTRARSASAGSCAARYRPTIRPCACTPTAGRGRFEIAEVLTYLGLKRIEVAEAEAGDIVAVTGVSEANIGDTLASPDSPKPCRASRSASRPWR